MIPREQLIIENLFMIPDKDGNEVPFMLNETQAELMANLSGRDIVAKARQEGVSSLMLALFTVRCLYKPNTRAVVISHDRESTERLFRRVKYFLENLRGPKPVLDTSSKREFSFPKTNSVFYIGTAGGRKFGRGDTITDLHCSEVGFWDNAKELTAGLFQAVPRTGFIGLESTGNGRNFFYRRVMNAAEGKGRYKLHFFNWVNFSEYDIQLTKQESAEMEISLDETLDEVYLRKEVGLTLGQLKFRREKLEELDFDLDLFKQEYPITLDECFRASGSSIFHKINYVQTPAWQKQDRDLYVLAGHPKKNGIYGIGADVAGGVGKRKETETERSDSDNSVAEVFDLESGAQVAEWADNKTPPDVFAHRIKDLGELFNNAYVVVESNNHGLVTLKELRDIYPIELLYKKPTKHGDSDARLLTLGLYETTRSKPLALGTLRRYLADKTFTIHSSLLYSELGTFIEDADGKLRAEEGCHDDRVMACATLAYGLEKAQMIMSKVEPAQIEGVVDPFSLDGILDDFNRLRRRYPVGATI